MYAKALLEPFDLPVAHTASRPALPAPLDEGEAWVRSVTARNGFGAGESAMPTRPADDVPAGPTALDPGLAWARSAAMRNGFGDA
jgi:hypothetical protein